MHFKEGGKRKGEGDEIIREAERERDKEENVAFGSLPVFSHMQC